MKEITTLFVSDGVYHSLQVHCDDNISYSLAALFAEVVEKTNANAEIIVGELTNHFNIGKDNG